MPCSENAEQPVNETGFSQAITAGLPQHHHDGWGDFARRFEELNHCVDGVWQAREPFGPEMGPWVEPEPETEYPDLYFIGCEHGPIKIGVSVNPAKRLKGLQTGYPYTLRLLAVVRGGAMQECEYHARFAEHRLNGEWFAPHPDILAEIERLGGGL